LKLITGLSDKYNTPMKIATYILMALALGIIIFNITQLDYNNLFEGNSIIGLIGIVASLCALLILAIFRSARLIEEKTSRR
jgi:hypothetical protein